jgi:hypothetical protein
MFIRTQGLKSRRSITAAGQNSSRSKVPLAESVNGQSDVDRTSSSDTDDESSFLGMNFV